MSNTAAGTIFLGVVVLLCLVGWWSSRRPRNLSPGPTATDSPAANPTDLGDGRTPIPTGPVRIVNRKTGDAIWPRSLFQIEPAGDYYKIRWQNQYLAPVGREAPLLRHVPDSKRPAVLWDIKPLGDGFWTITNRGSGKCLEMHKEKPPIRQSQFREGALEQQWRFEAVKPEGDSQQKTTAEHPAKSGTAPNPKTDHNVTSTQNKVRRHRPPPQVSPERFLSRDSEHVKKGFAAGSRGDWDLAHREFTAAIEFNGRDAKAYCGRAWAKFEDYWQKGTDPSNASIDPIIEDCSKANELDPADPDAFFVRGSAWLTALAPDRAISPLSEAIRLDPKNPSYYCVRAYANAWISVNGASGVTPTEVEDCSQAIRVDSNYAIAYVCRGWYLDWLNRKGEARADYDKALSIRQTKVPPDRLKLWIAAGFAPGGRPRFISEEVTRGLFYHSANHF
jgi:tetratricopeptide (TPR) repeat protein